MFYCAIFIGLSCALNSTFLCGQEIAPVQEAAPVEVDTDEAVEDDEPVQVGGLNQFGLDPKKMMAVKTFYLSQIFSVEIDELKRVCELDPKQVKKLTVAAKGAVKKAAAKWKKTAAQRGGIADLNLDDDDQVPASDQPDIVINDADEIDEMTLQMVVMNNMGNPFKSDDPRDDKFWRKTLAGVLTDEQSAKFKTYRLEREMAKREALIASTVNLLATDLALTDEQQTQLTELVTPPMKKAKLTCPVFYEPYVLIYYASKVDEKKLKELLSPAQIQKWKIFMAPAKQVGQMMEMEDAQDLGVGQGDLDVFVQLDQTLSYLLQQLEHVLNFFEGP